jgi:hypothetical protein
MAHVCDVALIAGADAYERELPDAFDRVAA